MLSNDKEVTTQKGYYVKTPQNEHTRKTEKLATNEGKINIYRSGLMWRCQKRIG